MKWKKNTEKFYIHDLYENYSDFKIDVKKEQNLIEKFNNIIFQFPIQWFSSPALLKEWIDKVFEYGWAYGSNGKALKDKNIGLVVSLGGDKSSYQGKSALENILFPFENTFNFVGSKYQNFHAFYGAGYGNNSVNKLKENIKDYFEFIKKFK